MMEQNKENERKAESEPKKTVYKEINWEWVELMRSLSVPDKNRMAFAMADFALDQKCRILAEEHPDWTGKEVDQEARRLVFGVSLDDLPPS